MGTGRKWMLGCGIGCAVVLGFGALLTGGTVMLVKHAVENFHSAKRTQETLVNLYGPIESYTPAWDGTLAPERVERFLKIREATGADRGVLAHGITEELPDVKSQPRSPRRTWRGLRLGMGLANGLSAYVQRRNEAMLDAGMGPGEYAYLYCVVYFAWLGEDPGAGPPNVHLGNRGRSRIFSFDTNDDRWQNDEGRRYEIRTRANAWMRAILSNQLAAVPDTGGAEVSPWRAQIAAEVQKLEDDKARVPWQDGLPETTRASLEPFRDRLTAQWSPMTNLLELLFLDSASTDSSKHDRHRRDRDKV